MASNTKYQKLKNMFGRTLLNRANFRIGIICKVMWYLLVAVMVVEFLVLNCIILYAVSFISNQVSQFKSPYQNPSLFEKLQNNDNIRKLFNSGKEGGFVSIIQETIERLYLVHEERGKTPPWTDVGGKRMRSISFIGLDVSHSGESSYLYKRIFSRESFPYHFLVVDIGANDGFVSSNSFNFIQWGWDALLVEPQADQMKMAKINVNRYVDPGSQPPQKVDFVQAVIGNRDGHVQFVVKPKTYGTESHIYVEGQTLSEEEHLVSVPCFTVQSLVKRYSVPRKFGILSIDAEGQGAVILRQWLVANFTPAYIIFERLHQQESIQVTIKLLNDYKYEYIESRGWNMIFEHQP